MEIKDNGLYFLYKRGRIKDIKNLSETGEVYINTIEYIRNCDNNEERCDLHDGISNRKYIGDAEVKICEIGLDIDKHEVPLNAVNCVMTVDNVDKGNIFVSAVFIPKTLLMTQILLNLTLNPLANH